MLGVDGCEGVELPAIVEIADRSRQLNRQCELRGEYDASRNYCLAALALQREGVSWQERAIVSQEQSSKPIVPSEYAAYMTTTETMIVVNPRRSGEVMISAMGEWKFYCVELTTEAVRLVLWKYITG